MSLCNAHVECRISRSSFPTNISPWNSYTVLRNALLAQQQQLYLYDDDAAAVAQVVDKRIYNYYTQRCIMHKRKNIDTYLYICRFELYYLVDLLVF